MRQRFEIGILFSRSGGYVLVSDACRASAMAAIADINADPDFGIELVPVERDPGGSTDRYAPLCEDIFRSSSARHVVGCVTSWSRKEVIPVLEKHGATLWYGCPYEGYEASDHVFYTHACPNQHLVPLLGFAVPRFGARGYLVGSNYIWGWEMNRVARELLRDAGGEALGERCLALGDEDVSRLIQEIEALRPSFVLNNLIGPSSYAFLKAMAELGRIDPAFRPEVCPVLSCNLTECETSRLDGAADGQISAGPYFARPAERLGWPASGTSRSATSFEAATYMSVRMLAEGIRATGRADPDASAFVGRPVASPFGMVEIDPVTRHTALPVIIGRMQGSDVEALDVTSRILPDPYLTRYDRAQTFPRPALKVVMS